MAQLNNKTIQVLLTSKDLVQYLQLSDIGELGFCNNLMYNKCKKLLFRRLKLEKDKESKDMLEIEDAANYYDRILLKQVSTAQDQVIKYKEYISSILVGSDYNYFTAATISVYLPQLIILDLYNIAIPIVSFQLILDNLPNLRVLNLIEVLLVLSYGSGSRPNLRLPLLITQFSCLECHQIDCDNMHPIGLKKFADNLNTFENPTLNISTLAFDSLKEFHFLNSREEDARNFNEFLKNNDSISEIVTFSSFLEKETLEIISNNSNLMKLCITFFGAITYQSIENIPQLSNIKILDVTLYCFQVPEITKMLINSCPNLETFAYSYYPECELELMTLIECLEKLKNIKLINLSKCDIPLKSKFTTLNLETIELQDFNPFSIDLSLFSDLSNLKYIKITVLKKDRIKSEAIAQYFSIYNQWKALIFKDVIQLWKV